MLNDRRQDDFLHGNVGRLARRYNHGRGRDGNVRRGRGSPADALDGPARCTLCPGSSGADADVGRVVVRRAWLICINPGAEAVLVSHVAHDPLRAFRRRQGVVAVDATVSVPGLVSGVATVVAAREVGELVRHGRLLCHQLTRSSMVDLRRSRTPAALQYQESS